MNANLPCTDFVECSSRERIMARFQERFRGAIIPKRIALVSERGGARKYPPWILTR